MVGTYSGDEVGIRYCLVMAKTFNTEAHSYLVREVLLNTETKAKAGNEAGRRKSGACEGDVRPKEFTRLSFKG